MKGGTQGGQGTFSSRRCNPQSPIPNPQSPIPNPQSPSPVLIRVLLVGGGHASLPLLLAADRLTSRGIDVVLLNDCPRLYYSGMIPEYLGGVYSRDEATIDLEAWCAHAGVRFHLGRATALDVRRREVRTEQGSTLPFDVAIFDVGAANPDTDAANGAIATKPLYRLEALHAFLAHALVEGSPTRRLVIVGGGAAGVEVALNVTARAAALGPERLAVSLVEPGERLLSGFPPRLQRRAHRLLSKRKVSVRLSTRATHATATTVYLNDGESIEADAVLWATGSVGQPFFREAGLRVDARGFVRVAKTLQVLEAPYLFVAGDAAVLDGYESLPRVGVHAVKQGSVLCHNVLATVDALERGVQLGSAMLRSFVPYPVAPLILSTGTPHGWMRLGPFALTGTPLLRLKHAVDRRWMRRYSLEEDPFPSLFDARSALST